MNCYISLYSSDYIILFTNKLIKRFPVSTRLSVLSFEIVVERSFYLFIKSFAADCLILIIVTIISRLISKEVPAIKEIYWAPIILTPIHLQGLGGAGLYLV